MAEDVRHELGHAIAHLYGSEGARVVIASRSAADVADAVDRLRRDGIDASGQACDVSVRDEVDALRQVALDTYGRIDIWVNNAGQSGVFGPTVDVPPDRAALPALDLVLGTTVEHQALGFPQILGRTLAYQAKRLLGRAPGLQPLAIRIVEGRDAHRHG